MIWVYVAIQTCTVVMLMGAFIRLGELTAENKELSSKATKRQRAPRTKADECRKVVAAYLAHVDSSGYDPESTQTLRAVLPQGPQDAS